MPAKAVVLDLDGVYFAHGTPRFVHRVAERYGLSEDRVRETYSHSTEMREYKAGRLTGTSFWSYATACWGIVASQRDLLQMLADAYEENARALVLVQELRAQGIRIAACTNNFKERLDVLERRFRFRRHFDVFVSSHEEGVLKPDPRIFDILAARLGLSPDCILMSDDKQANVDTLRRLGFKAVLYREFDDLRQGVLA